MIEFEFVLYLTKRLRQCPHYTLNNLLLNFIEHMKKWGGQLDIRPPQSKNWGDVSPPISPGLTPLIPMQSRKDVAQN